MRTSEWYDKRLNGQSILLKAVTSSCWPLVGGLYLKVWKLTLERQQPYDLLAKNVIAPETKKPAESTQTGISDIWLPIVDTYRTLCIAPSPEVKAVFHGVRKFSGPNGTYLTNPGGFQCPGVFDPRASAAWMLQSSLHGWIHGAPRVA